MLRHMRSSLNGSVGPSIRPVAGEELNAWVALWNRLYAPWWVESPEWVRFADGLRPPDEPWLRLGAWSHNGELSAIAQCLLSEAGETYQGYGQATVAVRPSDRRKGIGSGLAKQVEAFAKEHRLKGLYTRITESELEAAAPMLQQADYFEIEREQTSAQETAIADLTPLVGLRRRLEDEGIATLAFSQVDSDGTRREFYRAVCEIERDMPTETQWQPPPFEIFLKDWFERPGSLPDAIFIAMHGERIVGVSSIRARPDGNADVGDTGVLQPFRRRGIARALKLMATRYAREHGMRRIYTGNNLVNDGMLTLNRELGFRTGPVLITFQKRLVG